jgi:ABC-2 type transport system ATP-binding protein
MSDPRLLVLDEPFSGLDPGAVEAMAGLLRELTGAGVGILFSSHQLEIVERLCDRIVVMAHGSVAASGSAEELRRSHGEVLHRLVVSERSAPLSWLHDVRGVEVRRCEPHVAVVLLKDEHAADRLLREALRHGEVRELAETVPTVAEIFREVAA